MIVVVQPPPSAKCGKTAAATDAEELRSTTGSAVRRKSARSFTTPRRATTATLFDELSVNEPEKVEGPLNGLSFKKPATCPFAGMVVEFEDTSRPLSSVNVKETTTGSAFGFAIARPLFTVAFVSP